MLEKKIVSFECNLFILRHLNTDLFCVVDLDDKENCFEKDAWCALFKNNGVKKFKDFLEEISAGKNVVDLIEKL